ncbi:PQQ-like beta-propeller repeat protein [Haloprofundus sp. MHR1]|uniref:outer membrane protein assembly factor BamB family protein n=1 Tax=Haloprofundus sp. MHR1 TaxID=2572921 RepID=UPI00143D2278|nr:PQQ-like beta-propeller repeat protein [Haloprofundus sp. MHR1]
MVRWQYDGLRKGLFQSPVATDGTVYLNYESEYYGDDPNVVALDAGTGAVRWSVNLDRFGNFRASPTIDGQTLYVPDGTAAHAGNIHALDTADGRERWQVDGPFMYTPAVADGVVYAGFRTGVCAIDAGDGTQLWQYDSGEQTDAAVTVTDETVLVPQSGRLRALEKETGRFVWEASLGQRLTSPVAVRNSVFVGTKEGTLFALDVATGSVIWSLQRGEQIYKPPVATDELVFFGCDDGRVSAVTTGDGDEHWSVSLDEWVRDVTLFDGVLCVNSRTKGTTEHGLYALSSADGALLWKFQPERSLHTPAIAADGTLFVGGYEGLFALTD